MNQDIFRASRNVTFRVRLLLSENNFPHTYLTTVMMLFLKVNLKFDKINLRKSCQQSGDSF